MLAQIGLGNGACCSGGKGGRQGQGDEKGM